MQLETHNSKPNEIKQWNFYVLATTEDIIVAEKFHIIIMTTAETLDFLRKKLDVQRKPPQIIIQQEWIGC